MPESTNKLPFPERLEPPGDARALIFDCDGTLADTEEVNAYAYLSALERHGVTVTKGWYVARSALSDDDIFDQIESRHGIELCRRDIASLAAETYRSMISEVRENAAVTAVARAYHGRKALAVASGAPRILVKMTLQAIGLSDLFSVVVTADDAPRGKPAPDLYTVAVTRLGLQPANCVAYEDTDGGIQAALAAGVPAIDVRPSLPAFR